MVKDSTAHPLNPLSHRPSPRPWRWLWLAPVLLSSALLLTVACTSDSVSDEAGSEAPQAAVEPLPERPDILLITVDTLRADHVSSYGYQRVTSPVIDLLAAEGVRFDQPMVQWPKTSPSFASIFTTTYPKDNGIVRRVGKPLDCRFYMLAEHLRDLGYGTHAVVANGALATDFYFDQGFDTYIETWKLEPPEDGSDPNRAEIVTHLAQGLLDRISAEREEGKPYFLWVHYLDPHAPYTPPGKYSDMFQGDEFWSPEPRINIVDKPKQQMAGIGQTQVLDGRDELDFYRARYDAEIAYNDEQVGILLDSLEEQELMSNTLTVFTSDHGESLGEHHYYFDHGRFSFETCLRVPLIFHYPGVLEPKVDGAPVELIHLGPTLLQAAGADLSADGSYMQGRSLLPRLRGEPMPPWPAGARGLEPMISFDGLGFAEAGWETRNKWQKVVRDQRFKLIFAQTTPEQRWIGGEGVRFTLFDLENDPMETRNVAEEFPQDLQRLQRALQAWDGAERFSALVDPRSAECGDARTMDSETEDLLRSLGYL
ncbi:MAG: sulfatase [Acidobacteriota bacterium]